MAKATVTQVRGNLTSFPVTVATGDTVANETQGTLSVVITEEVALGSGTVRQIKDGELVTTILPGVESAAFTLAAGEEVKLSGFGNFSLRDKSERTGRNPKTGKKIKMDKRSPEYKHLKLKDKTISKRDQLGK